MLKKRSLVMLIMLGVLSACFVESQTADVQRKAASWPLVFEKNAGQAPSSYGFVSHQGPVESLFSNSGVDIIVPDGRTRSRVRFRLIGARPDALPQAREALPSVSNYLVGNDPAGWIHGAPNHGQVIYPGVYPGIDLMFHGKGELLEHDFRVSTGANPDNIRFAIDGGSSIKIDSSGDLEISLASGTLHFQKPEAYQESRSGRQYVDAEFVLQSDNSVRFRLGQYDPERELVIDPVFGFSTYLAGNTADYAVAVTTDLTGNVYVTGYTYSTQFPIVNGLDTTDNGSPDVYVSKLDPTGHTLLYSTYLGGSSRNYGNAIALDPSGNIVVAGTSGSNDFPHVGSVPSLTCEGNNDCFFIASLKPDGSAFNYAGLIGGIEGTAVATGQSGSGVLAIDSVGNAYLAGVTDDSKFEITAGTLSTTVPGYPYNSTFVLKVNKEGGLAYSTIVPGKAAPNLTVNLNNVFVPNGIKVNVGGNVTIAGTAGPGLPSTSGVIQPTFPNASSENASAGFVLQLNAKASAINYATYVTGTDLIGGLAVEASGDLYIAGETSETNLPVGSNAYQKTMKTGPNCTCKSGYILELNPTGTAVLAATYLEGTPNPYDGTNFTGIALDSKSNVFVGGMTGSTDFPLQDPFTSLWVYGDSVTDMVLAEMSSDLSSLLFGSFLSSTDQVFPTSQFGAIAVDHQDNLIVFGQTSTTDFPTTPGSFQSTPPSQAYHGFIAKLDMAVAAPSFCPASWSLSFGDVAAKKSATQILNVTNCGNAALHIGSIVSSAATIATQSSCATVSARATCPITVKFAPRDSSSTGATLTFADDAVISPQIVSVSGQGVAPQLSPSSGSISFGHLLVNTVGVGNSLFFWNNGNAALRISSVSVDGDFTITQDSCIGTLQPESPCSLTITFSPTASGIRTGTLMIVSNDPVYPKAGISLNGIGDTVYAAPLVSSLGAPTAQINNGSVTVQVYGANFYPASVLEAAGKPQVTTYLGGSELQATLDSTVASKIGEVALTVVNPAPGGGTSVSTPFTLYNVLNLNAAFITAVPSSSLLYASIPSSDPVHPNTVIPITPSTGAQGKPIPVGNNPTLLAPSSDGKYLFVVSNTNQTVQRINLATRLIERTFAFPPNSTTCCGALAGFDMKGMPGSPQQVVVAFDIPGYGFGEMALYNDSGMVNYIPTSYVPSLSLSSFAYASSPLTIYALPFTSAQTPFFNVINITAQGLQYTAPACCYGGNNSTGSIVVSDGTLLYTGSGEVWNPATQTQVGSFPVTVYNNAASLVMDTASGHLFTIGDENYLADSSSVVLSAYGQKSLALTGALAFPQVPQPTVENLVRWGTSGFAFISQDSAPPFGQSVYLLTSSLAKSVTSNPVPKVNSIAPSSAPQNAIGFQLTLNGAGFTESSVVNWNGVPLTSTLTSNTVLTATVPPANLSSSGNVSITVRNPSPGGGTSNVLQFKVAPPTPLISFSSSAITFATQKVATASTAKVVAVQNPGTASLSISSVRVSGTGAASFHQTNNCGKSLAPGANCSLSIVFTPISTGSQSATISFTDDAVGSPQTISVAGVGD